MQQRSEAQIWADKIAAAEQKSKQQDKKPTSELEAQEKMSRTTLANLINDIKPKTQSK
jgi:hypothetical protein